MELSPRQRSAVFAAVVIVLAALGYFLVVPAVTHSHRPAATTTGGVTSGPTATDYVGAMGGLITGQLAATLRAAYQTPGVASLRTSQQQVSTGTAVISSLRAFGPSSMTFIVTAGQRLATTKGTSSGSTRYAVTLTGSGGSWQVSDIELESAGNS